MTNAFDMLIKDHKKVKQLLEEILESTDRAVKTREDLFSKVKEEVQLHSKIEEEILYPVLEDEEDTKDLTLESYEEHHVVDVLLAEIDRLAPTEEEWLAKVTVLKENLEHHIKEEEGELFPKAEKILDKDCLKKLQQDMEDMKKSA